MAASAAHGLEAASLEEQMLAQHAGGAQGQKSGAHDGLAIPPRGSAGQQTAAIPQTPSTAQHHSHYGQKRASVVERRNSH